MAAASANTVRLGFDDGQPSSAPVDSFASGVDVEVGTAAVGDVCVVLVTPRDASTDAIGRGLDWNVDAMSLGPAVVNSALDLGNGSYRFEITSVTATTAIFTVSVEGVSVAATATLSFQ